MHLFTTALVWPIALWIASGVSQIVSPFATHDCSTETVYTGDHQCNNIATTCCAATGVCCAGGCCPASAVCVFQGTSKEACCSLSDSTLCGSVQPQSSKTCPNPAGPSVPCSGVGSTWYCAHGCTCDNSRDHGCNCFAGSCPGAGSGASTSPAAPTSTYVAPAESSTTNDDDTESSTSVFDATSTLGVSTSAASVGSAQKTTGVPGSGSSTTASAATTAATTKASDGKLRMQIAWALGIGIMLLGVSVVL